MTDNDKTEDKASDVRVPATLEEALMVNGRLRQELSEARSQAANYRVQRNEAREQLKETKTQLDSAKTPDEYNALAEKLAQSEKEYQHKLLVAQHSGDIPEEIRNSISWPEDEAGIKETAKRFSTFRQVSGEGPTPGGGLGNRGTGDDSMSDPAALAAMIPR